MSDFFNEITLRIVAVVMLSLVAVAAIRVDHALLAALSILGAGMVVVVDVFSRSAALTIGG